MTSTYFVKTRCGRTFATQAVNTLDARFQIEDPKDHINPFTGKVMFTEPGLPVKSVTKIEPKQHDTTTPRND